MEYNLLERENLEIKNQLQKRCSRMGLKLMPSAGLIVHQHDNWIVEIFYAKDLKSKDEGWVVAKKQGWFWLEDETDWSKCEEEMRICRRR